MPTLSNLAFQASDKLSSLVGNPGQMMSKEIYKNAIDSKQFSQYRVAITTLNSLYTVKGLLTDNLSLSIDAKWEATGLIDAITSNPILSTIYPYITMFAGAAGIANPSNVGISTRKIYTSSGYLEFDIKFRVVDWQGTGEPIKAAFILSTMCLPTNTKSMSAGQTIDAAGNLVISELNKVLSLAKKVGINPSAAIGGVDDLMNLLGGAVKELGGTAVETVESASSTLKNFISNYFQNQEFLVIAASPSPVTVEIGQYFRHPDMVVQSVKMDFSRQITSAGPLYSDFTVNVSSRQSILLDNDQNSKEGEIGLLLNGNKARVYRK